MTTITEPLFSIDDHIVEPAHVYTDRVPRKYRDRAPRMIEDPGGVRWEFDGEPVPAGGFGLEAAAGLDPHSWRFDPGLPLGDIRKGCYDATARLEDMDLDGIAASVLFPSAMARFVGARFSLHHDKDLAIFCLRAYNNYMMEEWYDVDRDRLLPVTILPLWDPALAAAEVYRMAERGSKSVSWSEGPHKMGFPSIDDQHWDPLFGAIQETGMAMSTHIGSSTMSPYQEVTGLRNPKAPFNALLGMGAICGVTELLFSTVFERFPELQIVVSEGGIGWVPYILEHCEYVMDRHPIWTGIPQHAERPLEIFKRNINVCFIEDRVGIELRHRIGIDKIMWECDYPHSDTSWPNSRKMLGRVLDGCSPEEIIAIVRGNAERVYRHRLPEQLLDRIRSS